MAFQNTVTRLSELVADVINGAEIIGGTITGALIQTAETGARWIISNGTGGLDPNVIASYSGDATETDPAKISTFANGVGGGSLILESNTFGGSHAPARLSLSNNGPGGTNVITLDSLLQMAAGDFVRGISFGVSSMTFDASGNSAAVFHSLGVVPVYINMTHDSTAVGGVNISLHPVGPPSTSAFRIHARLENGSGPYVGSLGAVRWVAIA